MEPGAATISIGRPLSNTTAHVLDRLGAAVPVGVAGELHIGGDGLATGYLNRPELTEERFIAHPRFGRLYQPGELCRRLPDGNLVYVGRLDQQIKLRGFRIEPGDIGVCLMRVEGLRQAVVVPRTSAAGEACLVAYYTAAIDIPAALLRQHVQGCLPHYMVPAAFISLGAVTANRQGDSGGAAEPGGDTEGAGWYGPWAAVNATQTQAVAHWVGVKRRLDGRATDQLLHPRRHRPEGGRNIYPDQGQSRGAASLTDNLRGATGATAGGKRAQCGEVHDPGPG